MKTVLVLIAAGMLLGTAIVAMRTHSQDREQTSAPAPTTRVAAATKPEPAPPIATEAPSLDGSDAVMHDELARLIGAQAFDSFIKPDAVVRRIVALVDSLPRKHIAPDAQPVKPIMSAFIATGDDQPTPLAAENYAKYAPYVELVQRLDTAAVSAVYFKYAASFQRAYQDLTHTDARFDARVLEAIDSVLGAPDVREPIMVVRRDAHYEFANPQLESLPVGSKLMLRMGPTQASIVKSRLRALRDSIAKHATASP